MLGWDAAAGTQLGVIARTRNISFGSHLKNVGLAFRIFATDNTNAFPFHISTNLGGTREWSGDPSQAWRHFDAISNQLSSL